MIMEIWLRYSHHKVEMHVECDTCVVVRSFDDAIQSVRTQKRLSDGTIDESVFNVGDAERIDRGMLFLNEILVVIRGTR